QFYAPRQHHDAILDCALVAHAQSLPRKHIRSKPANSHSIAEPCLLLSIAPSSEIFGREIAGVIDFEPEARAVGRAQDHPFAVISNLEIAIGGHGHNPPAERGRAVHVEAGRGTAGADADLARV